jgi:hypothetical protein
LAESGALPGGVSFQDNHNGTATLAGTPSAGTDGTDTFTITASNGVTPAATQTFTLTVTEPATPNQRYVFQLYQDLLGRAPDSAGAAYWTGLLDQGLATRTQVALLIENTPEYQSRLVENLYQIVKSSAIRGGGLTSSLSRR